MAGKLWLIVSIAIPALLALALALTAMARARPRRDLNPIDEGREALRGKTDEPGPLAP